MRIVFIIILILLQSCQTNKPPMKLKNASSRIEKDGPPKEIKPFKMVQMKKEPLSRYGNPSVYMVNGQTYKVLRSSHGYKTTGLASWYGTKFHQKKTANGDNYDMFEMTAAHKTLPLPTYLRVKNLENNQEIIVKVNDRGPFHQDRLIDLSYAAASKLGFQQRGTAPVEIEALTASNESIAHYYLQAGAFKSPLLAKLLQQKLVRYTPSPIQIEQVKEHYIVKIGPLADEQMSTELKSKLSKEGFIDVFTLLQ